MSAPLLAVDDVRLSELEELQRAARTLLGWGLVTDRRPSARAHRLVRRWAEPLGNTLADLAGYTVRVEARSILLVRRLDRLSGAAPFVTPSGRPFDRSRYALLALALAALERSGGQVTLTELAQRVRHSASTLHDLAFDPDQHASRLALSHAVRALEDLGGLSLTDGSREAWEQGLDEGEALFDVDRVLCRQVFRLPGGLPARHDAAALLHPRDDGGGRDAQRKARRQRLARTLLERPVVYFDDLEPEDLAFLQREAGRLGEQIEQLCGARLERRREGLALVDPGRTFSDRPFPGSGSDQQAALLLIDRLCARSDLPSLDAPHADEASDRRLEALGAPPQPPRPRAGRPFASDAVLREEADAIREAVGPALRASHREGSPALLDDALDVLTSYDLLRRVPGGVALMPALARFRAPRITADEELAGQLGLFGRGR